MQAHAYFGIDLDIVWDVVQHKITRLKVCVAEMIDRGAVDGEKA